jgi:hypothetical protein
MKITINGSVQEIADLMDATGLKRYEFEMREARVPATWDDDWRPPGTLDPDEMSARALEGFRKLDGVDGVSTGDNLDAFSNFAEAYVNADPQARLVLVRTAFLNGGVVAHMLECGSVYESFVDARYEDSDALVYTKFVTANNPEPTLRQVCASIITLASLDGLLKGPAAPLKNNMKGLA